MPWLVDGEAIVVVVWSWGDDVWDNPEMRTAKKPRDGFYKVEPPTSFSPKKPTQASKSPIPPDPKMAGTGGSPLHPARLLGLDQCLVKINPFSASVDLSAAPRRTASSCSQRATQAAARLLNYATRPSARCRDSAPNCARREPAGPLDRRF